MNAGTNLMLLALLGVAFAAAAQYSIGWQKVAGGGGAGSNGQYAVRGAIGQHDAGGAMTNGQYSLAGGFWALVQVIQTPGAPALGLRQSGNSVIVFWPAPSTGWVLQQNADVAQTNAWISSGYTITTSNGTNSITVSSPAGKLFFRLKNP